MPYNGPQTIDNVHNNNNGVYWIFMNAHCSQHVNARQSQQNDHQYELQCIRH